MLFNPRLTLDQQRQELQKMLQPTSDDAPSGANARSTPVGREQVRGIETLFREAITAERKLEEYRLIPDEDRPPPAEPKWTDFLEQASDFLTKTSKDMVLATLATEAAVRETGPRGLLLGLELMVGYVDQYWPNVYPLQDADATANRRFAAWKHAYDWPDRLAPRLENLIKISPAGTTFADYAEAVRLDDPSLNSNVRDERIRKGGKTTDVIKTEIRQRESYFKSLYEDLLNCRAALAKLTEAVKTKCVPPDAGVAIHLPDFSQVAENITRMISSAKSIAWPGLIPEESAAAPATADSAEQQGSEASLGAAVAVAPLSGQMTREVAFKQLQQLADFFRRTEPHSPISYAIEQTVRWGKMSLPDLLTELIANVESRKDLFVRTGLPNQSEQTPT